MASPRVRRRLRAWVAELLWRLGAVDTFEQLAALESRIARARAAACVDPPACRALALAHQQTSWRLANRLCGGLLESLDRVVALARNALDGMGRALAQLFAALTTPSARKATPCPTLSHPSPPRSPLPPPGCSSWRPAPPQTVAGDRAGPGLR